jgi:hypothetical protein
MQQLDEFIEGSSENSDLFEENECIFDKMSSHHGGDGENNYEKYAKVHALEGTNGFLFLTEGGSSEFSSPSPSVLEMRIKKEFLLEISFEKPTLALPTLSSQLLDIEAPSFKLPAVQTPCPPPSKTLDLKLEQTSPPLTACTSAKTCVSSTVKINHNSLFDIGEHRELSPSSGSTINFDDDLEDL